MIGNDRASEVLTNALQDNDAEVREAAKNALESIRKKKVLAS
jgi:HEAT repeat protein